MSSSQEAKSAGIEVDRQKQSDDDRELAEEDEEEYGPPVPPDGGWGWLVVIGSFLTNLIVDGICYTFGIIMPGLLETFESSKGKTALVGSLVPGMYLIVGPFVSALSNRFGCRIVAMCGSLIAGLFFALSAISPNIDAMLVFYGVMGGAGFGMMYLPSIVMVGYYFDKKRALATGIAVCGSGIGTFLMAPFVSYLNTEYTWKGVNYYCPVSTVGVQILYLGYAAMPSWRWFCDVALNAKDVYVECRHFLNRFDAKGVNIILGAIIFHGIACAMLYLPLKPSKRRKGGNGPHGTGVFQNILEQKKRNRTISTGSLDGAVITKDNTVVVGKIPANATATSLPKIEENVAEKGDEPESTNEPTTRTAATESTPPPAPSATALSADGGNTAGVSASSNSLQNKQLDRVKYGSSARMRTTSTSSRTSMGGSQSKLAEKQAASPFARQDIFYTGSVTSLKEYKASPNMQTYIESYVDLPTASNDTGCCASAQRTVLKMFDFTLLKSPAFCIICLAGVLAFVGLYTPFVYVYQKALKLGKDEQTASAIILILGVFNTIGRLAAGWLADRPWADSLVIHNVSAILAGVLTCLVSVLNTFELLCVYSAFFGIFIAAFIALRSIVIVDILGIEKLTNAFGLTSLFQGVACLVGSPMSGAILEATDSFVWPFLVSGFLIGAGGLMCLPARRLAVWEEKRKKDLLYQKVKKNEVV